MWIFYQPNVALSASFITLDAEESKHATKVLRLGAGSKVSIRNGKGAEWLCEVIEVHKHKTELSVNTFQQYERQYPLLELAIAPTKNIGRIEWLIEKATEIGVDRIQLLGTKNTERPRVNLNRLQRIAIEANKQSQRFFFSEVADVFDIGHYLPQQIEKGHKVLLAHCANSPREDFTTAANTQSDLSILIGPEGDFTATEIAFAERLGCVAVSLGNNRLRTETAGLVACTLARFKV